MFERSRFLQRYWIWIVISVILAVATLWSLYIWLDFTVIQTMYKVKAGLNWFAITFYYGYTFLFAALLALLTVNPFPGRSDLYEAVDAFRQRLGTIFGVSWVTIGYDVSQQTFATLPTPIVVFSRLGVDYLRVALFGGVGAEWMASGDECRAYLKLYAAQWEPE